VITRDRIFAAASTAAVLTGLVLGFRELGPPRRQRAVNADIARTRDLESISRAIDMSYHVNRRIPARLDELKKTYGGLQLEDPETKVPYEYVVLTDIQYQLCATFATDTGASPIIGEVTHPAGRYCTSYTVNKRLY
jgi:hypothetical protein